MQMYFIVVTLYGNGHGMKSGKEKAGLPENVWVLPEESNRGWARMGTDSDNGALRVDCGELRVCMVMLIRAHPKRCFRPEMSQYPISNTQIQYPRGDLCLYFTQPSALPVCIARVLTLDIGHSLLDIGYSPICLCFCIANPFRTTSNSRWFRCLIQHRKELVPTPRSTWPVGDAQ